MSHRFDRRQVLQQFGVATGTALLGQLSRGEGPPSKQRIKVGQIGVGHAHASKLSVYRSSPDYEVVGIVEPNEQLRQEAMQRSPYQNLPWMTEEQLLNVPGLQAVLVETEVSDLLTHAQRCIAAGKHVHLDKPAGASLPDYRRLLAEAEKKQLLVQMGYMYRYNPAIILLRQFLKEGLLGDVFEVHTVMSKVVPREQRLRLAKFQGGILFELGCHILDLVIGLLGKPTDVQATRQHVSAINDNLLDNMLAVLKYPRAIATVKSSALEVEGFDRRHLVVCGTEGTFHIQPLDDPAARVSLSKPHGMYRKGTQTLAFPKFPRYLADAADIARIIRGEKGSDFPYAHDLLVQETLLTACGMSLSS